MGNMVRQIKAISRKNGEPGHVRTVITLWFTLMLSWPKHKVLAKKITFWKVYWKAFFGQTSSLSYLTMWLPKERETWLRRNTVATSFECLHPSWLLLSKKLPTSRLWCSCHYNMFKMAMIPHLFLFMCSILISREQPSNSNWHLSLEWGSGWRINHGFVINSHAITWLFKLKSLQRGGNLRRNSLNMARALKMSVVLVHELQWHATH